MKLVSKNDWRANLDKPREFDVEDAVQAVCADDVYYDESGALERTQRSVKATGEFMGRLVQKLHEKGLLDDAEVLDLIGTHAWAQAGAPAEDEEA